MELTNEFVIDRDVEETWKILNDLEFIAPCMPGAQLQEVEGDEYRGIVKIKVGPITAQYKGKASFVEQDAVNKVARLKAEGRDPRQGNANAMVTAKMEPVGDGQTTVNIHTDLGLSGKLASFGRGSIEDVSRKLLGQFADNLKDKLQAGDSPTSRLADATPEPGATAAADSAASVTAADSATASATAAEVDADDAAPTAEASSESSVRKIESAEAEPVNLLAVTGGAMAKRMVPAAGGLVVVLAILYWVLGRS